MIEKLRIKQTSTVLSLDVSTTQMDANSGHLCDSCEFTLCEEGCKVFENLPALEDSIPVDTKKSLVYIAGYVTQKDDQMSENELLSVTTFYHKKYGGYVDSMDRGGSKIPTDSACQWTFFCYTMFQYVNSRVCRKSLSDIFIKISQSSTILT